MWLDDWRKRIELTIDSSKVDEDLTNFPVFIELSSSTGQTSADATSVFDELLTVSGSHKIAVATENAVQCYVEIEHWDWGAEKAYLWTKIPTIVSGTDTKIYLYYDSTKADNSTYVGDTGDTPAQNVWDSNFVGVWHMAQDPSSEQLLDSTSYGHDMNSGGSMTSDDLVDHTPGKGIDFDGSNDDFVVASAIHSDALLMGNVSNTFQAVITQDTVASANRMIIGNSFGSGYQYCTYGNHLRFFVASTGNTYNSATAMSTGTPYFTALVFRDDVNEADFFVNTTKDLDDTQNRSIGNGGTTLYIGSDGRDGAGYEFNGIMAEVRLSQVGRTDAWLKADYHSCFDTLLTFGSEEIYTAGYFEGYVYEETVGNPVSRQVYCYRRDTGALMASTTSSGDGYYYVETSYSGTHFLVALDDDSGTQYNLAALDWMIPATVS